MPTWTSNIPSQVKTYANVSAFPATGSVKTIYIAEDTDIAYYWTGSAYQSISIQDLSGLVPYTGATSDVDLGNNDLNAEGIKIKGTAGNGHLNLKHQSSNPSAGGQETVIFAGSDGEPRFKNDGNAVEQFASRQWVNLQGFITNVITALGFTPVPETRTVNGKALSSNITLTPSDIGSPSGSGTSSGTNTGDETQASILSKLGFYRYLNVTPSIIHTGTTLETEIEMITIPANTFNNVSDAFDFLIQARRPSGTGVSTYTLRFRIGTTTVMSSSTILASVTPVSTAVYTPLDRSGTINNGDLLVYSRGSNLNNDKVSSTASPGTTTAVSFNFTTTLYAFVSIQLTNSADIVQLTRVEIKNF